MRCCRSEGHLKPVSSEVLHHLCVFTACATARRPGRTNTVPGGAAECTAQRGSWFDEQSSVSRKAEGKVLLGIATVPQLYPVT